jgi:signal transduction histidine kinase
MRGAILSLQESEPQLAMHSLPRRFLAPSPSPGRGGVENEEQDALDRQQESAGTVPMTVAVAARLIWLNNPFYFALASMAVGIHLFFVYLTRGLHATALSMIEFRAEKDGLIAELEEAKAISDEARRRAEAGNKAKSRFLATMSHELRTPLNAIMGFSEVMEKELLGPVGNETYREYARNIYSSGSHLLHIINEILDLSRIEAGRYELHEETIRLSDVAEDCERLIKLKADSKGLQIVEDFAPDLPQVWADPRAMRQICLNLLSNALKFTPKGGRITVSIGLMDDVLMCAHDLAVTLSHRLESEGSGAKSFHLFLYRVDHKVMTFSVNAGRATRDAHHIARLFANRSERLEGDYDAGFGIDMIRLAASSVMPLEAVQVGAFESDNGAQTLDYLYDRVASRLGPLAVLRTRLVNTHIPEQAVKLEPVIARTGDDPVALTPVVASRPLRLLPQPELVSVALAEVPDGPPPNMIWRRVSYLFVKSSGPERISAEWWRSDGKRQLFTHMSTSPETEELNERRYTEGELSRDYYVAEDDGGRRFWIFREGLFGIAPMPKWYLHGFFG